MKYDLTDAQFGAIMEASRPVAMIALQCGTPSTPQENANRAWRTIAAEVGCRFDTIAPYPGHARSFTAEPLAQAIEARSATTAGRGPQDESAVPQGCAPTPSASS